MEVSLFLDSITDGIIAIDLDERITMFNSAASAILSIDGTASIGRPIREVIAGTRLPDILVDGHTEIDQPFSWHGVTIVTSRYPIRAESGEMHGAAAVFRDITELRRLAEEITNLREVRLLNEAIFRSTQDAISVVDEKGEGVLVNPAYSRVTGLARTSPETTRVTLADDAEIHRQVLTSGLPVHGRRMRVGPYKRDVIVDANPILVDGVIKGSVAVLKDVSELMQLHDQLDHAREKIRRLEARYTFDDVIGEDRGIIEAVERARTAAGTPATVLLSGESGTGKELFAHAIHNASERRNARFVRVNCAALSESVLESELFGYEGGAFTGARKGGRRGLFEEAHGGTIFLDEIGLMSLNTQAKLLRVLQEREIRRVGGNDSIPVNVRVVAASNLDLEREISRGTFREDLFYRLQVVPIRIPPLRSRARDLPILARRLLEVINNEWGRAVREIDDGAIERLQRHRWPGNVRELENVLRRAVVSMLPDEFVLRADHLPPMTSEGESVDPAGGGAPGATATSPEYGASATGGTPAVPTVDGVGSAREEIGRETDSIVEVGGEGAFRRDLSLGEIAATAETAHIRAALAAHGGNRTRTAAALGVSLRTLQYKMKRYGIV